MPLNSVPRQIVSNQLLVLTKGCDGGLSQADAAIVWWDGVVRPNLQIVVLYEIFEIFEEQFVLENAAREHDSIEIPGLGDGENSVAQAPRNAALESARDVADVSASPSVANDR